MDSQVRGNTSQYHSDPGADRTSNHIHEYTSPEWLGLPAMAS